MEGNGKGQRIVRLVDEADEKGLIKNKVFEDCTIRGPAMLLAFGVGGAGAELENPIIAAPSIEAVVYEIEPKDVLVGVIACENVVFRRCRFEGVGFLGLPGLLDQLRGQLSQ